MSSRDEQSASNVQYEPDENPPALVSLGSGLQLVVLGITSIIFIPTIVIRASGGTDAYLSWAVFGAVAVSGICTALQAFRLSRVGAGYLLFMGPAGAYIGVCVSALSEGAQRCSLPSSLHRRSSRSRFRCGWPCSGGFSHRPSSVP